MTAPTVTTRLPLSVKRGRPRPRQGTRKIASRAGFFVLIGIFVLVSLFPFYWILLTSLKTPGDLARGTTSLLPHHISFSAYADDFTAKSSNGVSFLQALINSLIVALATTIVTVVIATLAGYALARTRIRGRPIILGFILIAGFFPIMAMVGPLFLAYRQIGFLDSYQGLIVSYLIYTLPIATWFLTNFFSQIPVALEEAAIVDGASRMQTLRKIIIPVAMPAVFTVTILSFILAWNDFAFAVSFLQSPNKYTAPLAIVNLGQSNFETFYNRIDAAVVVITLPIALIVMFAQRRIVSGLTAGALK
jgi:ABC-type glycerol-3-phosphate transport system permease component